MGLEAMFYPVPGDLSGSRRPLDHRPLFGGQQAAASVVISRIGTTSLFLGLVIVCMALGTRTSRSRVDRYFGDLSYPVYVGHWLPLLVLGAIGQAFSLSIGAKLGAVFMSLAIPIGYFIAIEPAVARLRTAVRGIAIR